MLVDKWVEQVWQVLTIRKKTLQDYKNLYRRHLQPVIGHMEIDSVASKDLQIKLISAESAASTASSSSLPHTTSSKSIANLLVTLYFRCDEDIPLVCTPPLTPRKG